MLQQRKKNKPLKLDQSEVETVVGEPGELAKGPNIKLWVNVKVPEFESK